MSTDGSPVVDAHVHLSGSKAIGAWSKADYEIWEYGEKAVVRFGQAAGDLDDLRHAMRAGGVDHAVVVNAFSIDEWRGRALQGPMQGSRTDGLCGPLAAELIHFNKWLVGAVADIAEITPFVAVDPWLLSVAEIVDHLEDMRRRGARGIKVHPVEQRFFAADPRILRVYEACVELDLTVLAHSGLSRLGPQVADPRAFVDVAKAPERNYMTVICGRSQVAARCSSSRRGTDEVSAAAGSRPSARR